MSPSGSQRTIESELRVARPIERNSQPQCRRAQLPVQPGRNGEVEVLVAAWVRPQLPQQQVSNPSFAMDSRTLAIAFDSCAE